VASPGEAHRRSPVEGGKSGLTPISTDALKYLRYFQSQPYRKVAGLTLNNSVLGEMEYVLQRYLTYLLERQLKSVEFLKLIRREVAT
jgi:hypothetical protein